VHSIQQIPTFVTNNSDLTVLPQAFLTQKVDLALHRSSQLPKKLLVLPIL